ncbi:MAG TPA: hypothetical protein PKD90_18490, partial [Phnomibacter sp.]|nr:hypothetical protein [Phnomibacter sp.]
YHLADKKFLYTWGGPFKAANGKMQVKVEFDTWQKESVGQDLPADLTLTDDQLTFNKMVFKKIDDGKDPIAGCYRITGRMQNGTLNEMPKRARKTLKLLTGTRFQWMAINSETGEFFGTGGGRYTFANGKYTEHIEYFSRDSTRVGAALSFDGSFDNGKWRHSGLSSRGEPIDEIWTREEQ